MAKIKKSIPKNQNASVRCPKPSRGYEGPGFVERLREKIQDKIDEGRERRRERRAKPSTISRPEDRPIAIDYMEGHREKRNPGLYEEQTTVAKKGKTVVKKAKAGAKVKDKKWIQKAVNPKHKGYCTPMTKATCTPKRKALAKTFKKMAKARK